MDDAEARRRAELTSYIARSQTVQRRLRWLLLIGIGLTAALWLGGAGAPLVPLVGLVTAVVVGAGFWITQGHILDFRNQLDTLDAARRRRTRS